MSQIEELQGRIAAALDRISQGMDLQANLQLDAPEGSGEETAALRQELEDERLAGEQLRERNKVLSDRVEELTEKLEKDDKSEMVERLTTRVDDLRTRVEKMRDAMERFRDMNEKLKTANQNLRDANKNRVGEPHLINSSMITELENIKAERELEQDALASVLASLEAKLGDGASASDEEHG